MRSNDPFRSAASQSPASGGLRVAADIFYLVVNLVLLPFRLLWDIFLIGLAITLEVMWLGFVFGSVVGVILLLIFWAEGFLLPLALLGGLVSLWPEQSEDALPSSPTLRSHVSEDDYREYWPYTWKRRPR